MSNILESILEQYPDTASLKADGFDDAVIGYDMNNDKLIYSYSKCIEILKKDMSEEDAIDYFSYNVQGAYVGEKTPIYMDDNFF